MSEQLDKIFVREFNQTMKRLRGMVSFSLNQMQFPQLTHEVDTGIKIKVDGIDDDYYKKLNGHEVVRVDQRKLERNTYWRSGEVKGKETYHLPVDCLLVRTQQSLNLPFHYQVDKKQGHLDYVDYIEKTVEDRKYTFYFYAIPKKYLYSVTNTALVVSDSPKPKHYGGIQLMTTWGVPIYLYIVNVKKLKSIESQKILVAGTNPEYLKRSLQQTVAYLENTGQAFRHQGLDVDYAIYNDGTANLAQRIYQPTLEYEEQSDLTLGEEEHLKNQLAI